MNKIFETRVMEIGPNAEMMLEDANMIILFGQEVPGDLAEYCYKIENKNLKGSIKVGGELVIDEQHFPITLIGELVEQNLISLGHITISFDGEAEETLPGTLHVENDEKVNISEHSLIQIFA